MFTDFEISPRATTWVTRALQAAILLAASLGSAATPVESSLSAETLARICSDGTCDVILFEAAPVDTDA